MERLTQAERDELAGKRFYALPMSVVIDAQKSAVSIDDTCINPLKQKIQEQKEPLYVASFLKTQYEGTQAHATCTTTIQR